MLQFQILLKWFISVYKIVMLELQLNTLVLLLETIAPLIIVCLMTSLEIVKRAISVMDRTVHGSNSWLVNTIMCVLNYKVFLITLCTTR